MPLGSRILWAEDYLDYVDTVVHDKQFIQAGHILAVAITNLEQGKSTIPHLEPNSLDLAVVDGMLPYDAQDPENLCKTAGVKITALLKENFPQLPVIGNAFEDNVEGANHQSPKINGIAALLDLIAKI